ncbi:HNH endonuclease [Sphingomonas prati]|uniref:HNH nuclease domain-containing protein n=1 Tax=Sphingomonas prati TaxID=1843237 RepID=A0A7W9BV75_9SPHN|nr:HNH endonuclease signature motif containing protein [Sphingomonas prati]MBB5730615.1 hypothetical protein [Sphingomonas prati]GGE95416.1 hypothetical protein GCM10011404_30670 [Sphingomonas prati]
MTVTKKDILKKLSECNTLGISQFLEKYGFQPPRGVFLIYQGQEYPARAIWGAAHTPPLDGTYDNARMYHGPGAFQNLDPAFYLTTKAEYLALKGESPAIQDLDDEGFGNEEPEYRRRMAGAYIRNPEVRTQVLRRANGKCEYGGCTPFKNLNGQIYLETHHVISLSEQGIDRLTNVIALCANHHREAHFGQDWQILQDKFLTIIASVD